MHSQLLLMQYALTSVGVCEHHQRLLPHLLAQRGSEVAQQRHLAKARTRSVKPATQQQQQQHSTYGETQCGQLILRSAPAALVTHVLLPTMMLLVLSTISNAVVADLLRHVVDQAAPMHVSIDPTLALVAGYIKTHSLQCTVCTSSVTALSVVGAAIAQSNDNAVSIDVHTVHCSQWIFDLCNDYAVV
jgi:hypothetical protein